MYAISQEFRKLHIAEIYFFFANTSRYYGSFNIAIEYYQQELEIRKEQLGPNHIYVATSYNNLGLVYWKTGDLEKAKEYHQSSLEIVCFQITELMNSNQNI